MFSPEQRRQLLGLAEAERTFLGRYFVISTGQKPPESIYPKYQHGAHQTVCVPGIKGYRENVFAESLAATLRSIQ